MKVKTSITSPVFSMKNKIYRLLWLFFYIFLFRYSPVFMFKYRVFILKLFGAKIKNTSRIYPKVIIWSPKNLIIGDFSTLGPNVNVYNQGVVNISDYVIVSQGAQICASTHDYNDPLHPLLLRPVTIEKQVWVCADAFIGPGVILAEGGVVGARAAVFKNTVQWGVYSGNPAQLIKMREKFANGKA
jgi:putative colanic acid biosynthesis acetyltransferase WcaF